MPLLKPEKRRIFLEILNHHWLGIILYLPPIFRSCDLPIILIPFCAAVTSLLPYDCSIICTSSDKMKMEAGRKVEISDEYAVWRHKRRSSSHASCQFLIPPQLPFLSTKLNICCSFLTL